MIFTRYSVTFDILISVAVSHLHRELETLTSHNPQKQNSMFNDAKND